MSVKLLDPTLDIVFKLLLLRNQTLLRDMIEAVLDPPAPIQDLEVLNPEVPKDFPGDKGVVLDIRVRLFNGHQVDLEMQSTVPPGTRVRFLYYWAKAFANSMATGDEYTLLRPCISILWFKQSLLEGPRFHSIFHLSEDHSRETFAPEIEFHVLELPKLHLAGTDRQAKLERWARFLGAQTVEELEELAREDAVMSTAKDALQELSLDPTAQRLASERETAVLMHRHLLNSSREVGRVEGLVEGLVEGRVEGLVEGRVEGRVEGLVEGRVEGLIVAVKVACELIGLEVDEAKAQKLSSLTCEHLTQLLQQLKTERRWPDGF